MILISTHNVIANYNIPNGQVLIWRFTPEEGNEFYLKVIVNSNTYPLNLSAYIYDPYADTLTLSNDFSITAINYIYNESTLNALDSIYTTEIVNRVYANQSVECKKVTVDSDNILYVDTSTGVVCEASLNLGDVSYDLKLVSWKNEDLSALYSKKTTIGTIGMVIPVFLAFSIIFARLNQKLNKKK
ncbi:hypothetical protein [Candidatus Harpocratesius sp.]